MRERETIIGVLVELGRRLWIARTIRETAFVACVVAFCLVCFLLIRPGALSEIPFAGTVIHVVLLVAFAALFVEAARRGTRGISARQAAAEADARAHLRDELKSAYWFLSESPASPFAELQLQRAAATAARLDLAALVPRPLPGSALLAAGLGMVLVALTWMNPRSSHWGGPGDDAGPARLRESVDLLSSIEDAPRNAEIAKLELALRKLKQADASAGEKMRALADARDAIDQANMEASAARAGLAKLAGTLDADPKLAAAAQAMREGRAEDAMAQLRKLNTESAGTEEDRAIEPSGKPDLPESDGWTPEDSGRNLAARNAVVNQDAINRVINALRQANERIEVQNRVNRVRRRMEQDLVATTQRSQLTASRFDNRANAANPTPAPETGNADVRGGTLFRQAAVAREEADSQREGSQSGDASGDSAALPLEGVATARLDAQLKLETILQKDEDGGQPNANGDQGSSYSASREQKSMLQAEDVRFRGRYDNEGAFGHDRVPMRQKGIVKNYFLNLHESEKK